ncbi:MAG: hypothetical protein ACLP5H_20500 [Desulfomonilaceae bacterium]
MSILLLIQIVLIVVAFRRGWRWYVLGPLAMVICIVLIGDGLRVPSIVFFLVDILLTVVLISMCIPVDPRVRESTASKGGP